MSASARRSRRGSGASSSKQSAVSSRTQGSRVNGSQEQGSRAAESKAEGSRVEGGSRPPSRRTVRSSAQQSAAEEDLLNDDTAESVATLVARDPPFCYPETIDNHNKFMQIISELFNDPEFSDVRLEVGRREYNAHRILLAKGSDFFRETLAEPNVRESRLPVITLEERGDCARNFEIFLRFLYGDSITLDTENALPVLRLAEKYSSRALRDLTVQYMIHHCQVPAAANHTLSWYRYAKRCNLKPLQEACFNFILCNFDVVMQSPGWAEIGKNTLKRFIADSDLVVEDEYTLYQGVEEWLRNPDRKYKEEDDADDVLRFLRFPMIFPEQLQLMQDNDLFTELGEEFRQYFYDAFQFHATAQSNWNEDSYTIPQIQFCPRNYRSRSFNICQFIAITPEALGKKPKKKTKKKKASSDSEDSDEDEEDEQDSEEEEKEESVDEDEDSDDEEEKPKKPARADLGPNETDVSDLGVNPEALIGNASHYLISVSKAIERKDAHTPITFCRKVHYKGDDVPVAARVCTGFVRCVNDQKIIETVAIQDHTFSAKYRTSFMHYPPPDFRLESYEDFITEKNETIELVIFIKPQDDIYQ